MQNIWGESWTRLRGKPKPSIIQKKAKNTPREVY